MDLERRHGRALEPRSRGGQDHFNLAEEKRAHENFCRRRYELALQRIGSAQDIAKREKRIDDEVGDTEHPEETRPGR